MTDERAAKRQRRAEEVLVGPQAWGIPGIDGPAGPQGAAGATGAAGAPGADGEDGQDGAEGPQGPEGAAGLQGIQGVQGVPGDDGATGPAGPSVWGGITGTLSTQTDLDTALAAKSATSHDHAAVYAPIAKGVTNGDAHDHVGGDGAQIAYGGLSGIPSTFTPAAHTHVAGDVTGTAVLTADARLSDARTPLAHVHVAADITGTAVLTADARLSDARAPTAHVITGAAHTFPGGTTNFLREDGAFAAPTSTPADPPFAPGSFTVATGTFRYVAQRLRLTSTQRATLQGTGMLRVG